MAAERIPELQFTKHAVDAQGTLAHYFFTIDSRRGIYWLEFDDGSAYIGQSVDALARLSTHRRRWEDIASVSFAPVSVEFGLDDAERRMIAKLEAEARSLRNRAHTRFPGGRAAIEVEVHEGTSIRLPYERSDRARFAVADLRHLQWGPTDDGELAKYRRLLEHPCCDDVVGLLATVIDVAIPAPVLTQQTLWTSSAMPRTAGGRLCTVNAGTLEVMALFAAQDEASETEHRPSAWFTEGFINLDWTDPDFALLARLRQRHPYATFAVTKRYGVGPVLRAAFGEAAAAAALLEDESVADLLYALVLRMMRRGQNPHRRWHNPHLAFDAFACIAAWDEAERAGE